MNTQAHQHQNQNQNDHTSGPISLPVASSMQHPGPAPCGTNDVTHALHEHRTKRVSPAQWRIKACLIAQRGTCYWCDSLIDQGESESHRRARLDLIVRVDAGGTNDATNLVVVCKTCDKRKATLDPLIWCNTPEKMGRRESALSVSRNHLLTKPFTNKSSVVRELKLRWANPRYTVLAACTVQDGWISWSVVTSIPGMAAVLLRKLGGTFSTQERWTIVRLPRDQFLEAVWMMIETNGFVRQLDIPGQPDATLQDDIKRRRWTETYSDLDDLVRRRPALPNRWKPSTKSVSISMSPSFCIDLGNAS